MTKIAELYGLPTIAADTDWVSVVSGQKCPFLNGRKCLKNRKSEPEVTIGSCTVAAKDNRPVMICPFRLLQRSQIFEDCKALATLHEPGNEWHIIPELDVPGGSVDYCLTSVRKDKVIDFVGIELQTLDTTGTVWPERQRFLHGRGVSVKTKDRKSSKPFGINWKMTAKTTLVQLHHKIRTFEHFAKKLVLVAQDHLLAYMRKEFTFDHLTPARSGDPMHFHLYSLEPNEGLLRLQLAERFSTDAAGIARCLGLQSEAKVELSQVLQAIEKRITSQTLLSIEAPAPTTALTSEATEGES